ncbi:MAG: calcium-binding protein [Steroidobacteraceae bacterium]
MTNIQRPTAGRKKKTSPERSRLKALIAEATVDAYNESEQRMGFYTMLEEHLDLPFEATVLGVDNGLMPIAAGADPDERISILRVRCDRSSSEPGCPEEAPGHNKPRNH